MDDLLERLKARAADSDKIISAIGQVRAVNGMLGTKADKFGYPEATLIPPASIDTVQKAEQTLGFALPSLLREVYTKVANGGFGPGYGMLGLDDGGTDDQGDNLLGIYPLFINVDNASDELVEYLDEDAEEDRYKVLEGFLPICYYGCTVYALLDARVENGGVFSWDAGDISAKPEAPSLRAWLEDWLAS